jgi:hypothetical protein
MSNDLPTEMIEELPDRIAHRRKIAERLANDSVEYATDDPSRTIDRAGSAEPASGPGAKPWAAVARGSHV